MDAFNLGLQISGLGILITFLALGLLILVMVLLQAVFTTSSEKDSVGVEQSHQGADADPDTRLAVLAAAWWYWHKKRSSSLGKQLESGPGKRWRKSDKA